MPTVMGSSPSERAGLYWTIREVADHYRLHPETIRRWVAKGAIKSVRLGSGPKPRIRVKGVDVK
jgi:excisionase family DNA binding protein